MTEMTEMTDEKGNTGHGNTGHGNAGHWNAGDWNTGGWNAGDWNTGDWNTGDWNTGDRNTGHFNVDAPTTIRCFGVDVSQEEWGNAYIPEWLYAAVPTKGDMKAQWRAAYEAASPADQRAPADLPGFDPDIFEQIIGVRIEKDTA